MKLYDLFEKYASQNELKDILDLLELPNKGTKKEMLDRLFLEKPKYSTKKFLNLLSFQTLNTIKKDNNITFKRVLGSFTISKGELIDSIIDDLLVSENSPIEAQTGQGNAIKSDPKNTQESKPSSLSLGSVSGLGKSLFAKGGFFGDSGNKAKKETKNEEKATAPKSKLYEIIDGSSTKDVVKDILQGLNLEGAGNKDELISRLLDYTKEYPKDTFALFDLRTLQYAASKNNIPSRRSKEDQINELLLGLFAVPIPAKKASIEVKSELDQKFEALDEKGMKLYDLVNSTDKGSIQAALERVGKPVSGSKNELIMRLIESLENSPQCVLESFDGPSLWEMADNKEIKRRKIKQDQIDEILSNVFGIASHRQSDPVIETKKEPTSNLNSPPDIENRPSEIRVQEPLPISLFDKVVKEIEAYAPHKRFSTEEGYGADLNGYLSGRGFATRMEAGNSRADILVDEHIPLELKKSPGSQAYKVMFGELKDHAKTHGSAICVIFDVKRQDEFQEFEKEVAEFLNKWPIKIITK